MPDFKRIRPDIREALDRYATDGVPTGGFLRAVLSNDFMEAVGRADDYNVTTLADIASYVYCETPSACHGSPEIVKAWIELHHNRRKVRA